MSWKYFFVFFFGFVLFRLLYNIFNSNKFFLCEEIRLARSLMTFLKYFQISSGIIFHFTNSFVLHNTKGKLHNTPTVDSLKIFVARWNTNFKFCKNNPSNEKFKCSKKFPATKIKNKKKQQKNFPCRHKILFFIFYFQRIHQLKQKQSKIVLAESAEVNKKTIKVFLSSKKSVKKKCSHQNS